MNMNTNMGNTVYWHKNQVIIKIKSHSLSKVDAINTLQTIKTSTFEQMNAALEGINLNLQHFDEFVIQHHQQQQGEDAELVKNDQSRLRLLRSPDHSVDSPGNIEYVFFTHINSNAQLDLASMQGNAGTADMDNDDHTLAVINHLKNHEALQEKLQKAGLSSDTLPHWLWAGTGDVTQGCPISPPFPVEKSGASGQWKLRFSQLPDTLQAATGKGVTVFVLDTLPTPAQISKAASEAGSSNMLLQKMTHGMRWEKPFNAVTPAINLNYQSLPKIIEGTPPEPVVTGKDIYGRHVGFHMSDHGLFIAGIVRDLAPDANIECIRVLNDFGVGDLSILRLALISIQNRMLAIDPDTGKAGDLYNKPVVINLSLVVLPPEDDIPEGVTEDIKNSSLDLLYSLLQSLAGQGTIFVAAAGNDSDPRMNASEERFGPRYPAAFACDDPPVTTMISVGAVNRKGNAAMYSNHPGPNGVATYGGELPKPDPWLPSAMSHTVTSVDKTKPIDALRGVYSASLYPALSKNDHHPTLPGSSSAYPMYHASNTWAYWSGTSFATPIISALAARILQGRDPKSVDVQQAIVDAATGETVWTRVDNEDIPGPMIMAVQEWFPPVDPLNPNQ